ncbi:MAG: MraY family glycosyltransferase, partial [Gammaproteobacteria bacterium]
MPTTGDDVRVALLLAAVAIAAWVLTAWVRRYAERSALIDVPNARSSHSVPTPRGGGLAIVIPFLAAIVLLFVRNSMPLEPFMALVVGGGAVAGVGFWDDHRHVAAKIRILVHITAAVWALAWFGSVPTGVMAGGPWDLGWIGFSGFVVMLVWVLNLYNFMDGIDGIAAAEGFTVAGAAAVILLSLGVFDAPLWLGILAAGCVGFLGWNWPPAKVFMGDVGSGFLGFVLGVLAAFTVLQELMPVWSWLILLAVFLVDATFTLLRRMTAGARWYEAHRTHADQYAALRWRSHQRVTLAVIAINLFWL